MKQIWILVAVAAFAAAQDQTEKAAPKPAPKKTTAKTSPKAKGPVTIPADAKEISPGVFRVVDPKGQAWIYTKTPFGIMRGLEPKEGAQADTIPTDWKVTDDGDSVTFERAYPFGGTKRWTTKKSDLTGTEEAVWKRAQESRASSGTGGKN